MLRQNAPARSPGETGQPAQGTGRRQIGGAVQNRADSSHSSVWITHKSAMEWLMVGISLSTDSEYFAGCTAVLVSCRVGKFRSLWALGDEFRSALGWTDG